MGDTLDKTSDNSETNVTEFPSGNTAPPGTEADQKPESKTPGKKGDEQKAYGEGYMAGRFDLRARSAARNREREFLTTMMVTVFVTGVISFLLLYAATQNPQIFVLDPDTVLLVSRAFNALVLLSLPFILGIVGAISRLLLSGINVFEQRNLVLGSGLMACFSWIGVKSGVLVALIAPHINGNSPETVEFSKSSSDFYTLALVAIFVGMFSTNLYIFIREKVEKLSVEEKQRVAEK